VLLALSAAAVCGAARATAPEPGGPVSSAKALAVRIVFPNGRVAGSPAETGGVEGAPSFSYPANGSVVTTGAIRAVAKSQAGEASSAASTASNISLFDGEITADSVGSSVSAAIRSDAVGGSLHGAGVVHLQALGRMHAFGHAAVGDWGELTIARHVTKRSAIDGAKNYEGVSIALDLRLVAAHGGLPAGSEVELGYTEAFVQLASPLGPPGLGAVTGDRPSLLPPTTAPLVGVPQVIDPPLTAGPYIYPVYGPNDSSDTFGSSKTGSSWQHGVDLFGRLGQPLVAVAGGTLFSVGWNHSAGNRLWLRDRQGNQFYYSHLSAFSTSTANGVRVHAGEVIGFMGDTGNSGGEPTHLHFEVHPVSMLFLGADGAVNPESYLASWHRLASLSFPVATGWAPSVPGTIKAPEPGAELIGSADISTGSGLDPASLRRALRPTPNG
jgi:murein DD-endopeptidase MepM/ murein hydrolase activator NlpD